jgi:hypothetical protein
LVHPPIKNKKKGIKNFKNNLCTITVYKCF